jgi:large subunit ribosomal protein L6
MEKVVEIPEGVEVKLEGNSLAVKGPKGELKREFKRPGIKTIVERDRIIFSSAESKRRETGAIIGTWAALARNMVKGVMHGWVCRLRLVYSHFPVKLKAEEGKLTIQNFLGERRPRVARLLPGTEARVEKDEVVITGADKELVGQTCANIEQTCAVMGFDRRVFQDGIWILGKPEPGMGGKDESA